MAKRDSVVLAIVAAVGGCAESSVETRSVAQPALDRTAKLIGVKASTCDVDDSILPLSQQLHGVRLRGFLYALDGETLARLETRGLSNRVDQAVASISTEEGEGLVILTRPDQHPC